MDAWRDVGTICPSEALLPTNGARLTPALVKAVLIELNEAA